MNPTFKAPKGFVMPESVTTGEPFEMVCTLTVCKDGDLTLSKIGDMDLDAKDAKEPTPDYSNDYNSMQASAQANNLGGE